MGIKTKFQLSQHDTVCKEFPTHIKTRSHIQTCLPSPLLLVVSMARTEPFERCTHTSKLEFQSVLLLLHKACSPLEIYRQSFARHRRIKWSCAPLRQHTRKSHSRGQYLQQPAWGRNARGRAPSARAPPRPSHRGERPTSDTSSARTQTEHVGTHT